MTHLRWPTRAQVEPLAALVAVFAVGAALTAYTGVLGATLPTHDRNLAEPTVERAERAVSEVGVADPDALAAGLRAGPNGYSVTLTLEAAGRTWRTGPTPPTSADAAELAVSVRVGPGRVRPGTLRAEVWS
ncbi:hypothetical protein FXF75_12515 [Halorussus sp. MSC15.2]|nr:hypothetical protein [Halorussus sp. MSC15.2]